MAVVTPVMGANFGCLRSEDGTLGFFACFPNREAVIFAVTCSHSLVPSHAVNSPKPGAALADQTSAGFQDTVYLPKNVLDTDHAVGFRSWCSRLAAGEAVEYDCAIVRLTKGPSSLIGDLLINQTWSDTALPASAFLLVEGSRVPGKVSSQPTVDNVTLPGEILRYNNLYSIDYSQPGQAVPPIAQGMSGAPLIAERDGQAFLLGMHVGGNAATGYFHRADQMLLWLNMKIFVK